MNTILNKGRNIFKRLVNRAPGQEMKGPIDLPYNILVGTHHKTGTLWMQGIFRNICRQFHLTYFQGEQENLPDHFDVFMQNHSKFDFNSLPRNYRGIHIIRDPRDRIVSGAFYHQKSKEEWLHRPFERFDGMTYQEKINSFEHFDNKLMFEMENSGRWGNEEMFSWDYENPNFLNIKYEELIEDEDLFLFHKIFNFLGFPGKAIPAVLQCAYDNSLFSGNVKKSLHVRSGASKQWQTYFKPRHKKRFVELFDDALIRLGYEEDNSWAD